MEMNAVDYPIGGKSAHLDDPASGVSTAARRPISPRNQFVGAYAALLAFMFVYFFRPEDWIPGLSTAPFAMIAGVLALIGMLFSLPEIRQRLPNEIFYLALLLGQLFLASAFSPVWRGGAFQISLSLVKAFVVVVVMAIAVNSMRRLRWLIFIQAASAAVMAAATLWKGNSVLGRLEGVLGGNYSDPNDLALSFVISIPLCLAFLFLARHWFWKAVWTSAILAMTSAILETGSRGGFLALIVTAAFCLWAFAIRGRRPYVLVIAAALGVAISLMFGGMVIGRLKGTFNSKEDTAAAYASSEERQELFWRSVEVTEQHPLFGVGPGNFAQLSGNWHIAHNSYTQMSSEGGMPALILYLLVLWSGINNTRKARRYANRDKETTLFAKALHCTLIGYLVGAVFLSMDYAFYPFFLVAYTTSLWLIAKKSMALGEILETPLPATPPKSYFSDSQNLEILPIPSATRFEET